MFARFPLMLATVVYVVVLPVLTMAEPYKLSESSRQQLSEEGLEHYETGTKYLNHVLYIEALEAFLQARKTDPEHIGIRLLIAQMAENEARIRLSLLKPYIEGNPLSDPDALLQTAMDCYQEILDLVESGKRHIRHREMRRIEHYIQHLENVKANKDRVMASCKTISSAIHQSYLGEIRGPEEEEENPEEAAGTEETAVTD